MVQFTHTVVVCIVTGWKGEHLITMGLLRLLSSSLLVLTGELIHTVILYAHTVVLCVVKKEGGGPLINIGPFNWFSVARMHSMQPAESNEHRICRFTEQSRVIDSNLFW